MELTGKVVIVTGASSGIGQAAARRLAGEGARLVLAARRTHRIQMLAEEIGEAVPVTTDMRAPTQVRALVAVAIDAYGGVDVLVNNAGQGVHVPAMDIELDDLVAVTELNFYAPLVAMQAVVPIMRRRGGGSIVNVSSGTTLMVPTGTAGYAATFQPAKVSELPDHDIGRSCRGVKGTRFPWACRTRLGTHQLPAPGQPRHQRSTPRVCEIHPPAGLLARLGAEPPSHRASMASTTSPSSPTR